MNNISAIKNLLEINKNVTSQIIKDLIEENRAKHEKMKELYERYKASEDGVPIYSREFEDDSKINNQLANDFFSDIVDTKVGYFAGKPISYDLDQNMYKNGEILNEQLYKNHLNVISNFNIRNNIEDLDAETAKMAAICGYGARLVYIDPEGKEKVMNIKPWEAIFIWDGSVNEMQYSMRYYPISIIENNKTVQRTRVEWYDNINITFLTENNKGEYIVDKVQSHLFNYNPLICFPNNEEMQGDAEKVLSLIDAYDRTISDIDSEIEQFRLAYMAFYGSEPSEDTIKLAKRTGAFGLDENCKVEFITKTLNDTVIEHHLDRLEENILRFAKSVNFNDESFGGNLSGIAMKFKLFGLENKCITVERKFTASLRQQMKVVASAWIKKGINIDYINIFYTFKRNFPLNFLDEADTTSKLKGLVSERTRLSLLSFVDDVEYEIQLMEMENEDRVSLEEEVT